MQQQQYMHGTPHPQNPNVYVQQMPPQMNMIASQPNPYGMQAMGSPMMGQPGVGQHQQQGPMQPSDPQIMRFVRPQQQQMVPSQSVAGPASQQSQDPAPEPIGRPGPPNEEPQQQQQQPTDPAASTVQKVPVMEPTAETMGFKSLDQYGPLALCTLGKDVTREIVNQSVEFFKVCKSLQVKNLS